MTENDDFKILRRYTRAEVAQALNIPDAWLKGWVSDRAVPHQRSGNPGPRQRGVWFTNDNIRAIGKMLPELMNARQANGQSTAANSSSLRARNRAISAW